MINFQTTYIWDRLLSLCTHKGDVQPNDSTVVASMIENNLSFFSFSTSIFLSLSHIAHTEIQSKECKEKEDNKTRKCSLLIRLWLIFLLTECSSSDLYLIQSIAWTPTDIILSYFLLQCISFIFSFVIKNKKEGKKKKKVKWKRDQVNQQCEKILIKTPSFPLLCIKVTNLEAMLDYVWMSICIIIISRKKNEKEKGSCLSMSCSFFFLFLFLSFRFQSVMLFRLQMTFIHCLCQCECTHIFKWCWGQSIGNSAVWWSMIWACACGQAKGASLTRSSIRTWHI